MKIAIFGDALGQDHVRFRANIRWFFNRMEPTEVHTQAAPGVGMLSAEEALNLGYDLRLYQNPEQPGDEWPRPLQERYRKVVAEAPVKLVPGLGLPGLLQAVTEAVQAADCLVLYRNLRGNRSYASIDHAERQARSLRIPVLTMHRDHVAFDGTVWHFPNP